ncbi:hypothetical protein PIB30_089395 [Stylosanthes scabra]|uniref:Uncharacterized protein n=1 Tax=Stylosanthes scabra TaxID=79078 RepID=A0ABU6WSD7_9FABA|nr:hypothetical protein [Stylosanthes scabra]
MALNDHPFLTVDAVSLADITLVMGSSPLIANALSLSKVGLYTTTWGTERTSTGSAGRFGERSMTFDRYSFLPPYHTIRPLSVGPGAARPPRPAVSPSSSASSELSDRVPRERERSPRAPAPVYLPPRIPMIDAYHYRGLFAQHRAVPPTPPPSDDETSNEDDDEREDSQSASDASLSSKDESPIDASHGSERESTSFNSGPSSHSSSGSFSGNSSFGYCSVSGASSSNASSEDDLADRYFVGTFPPSMP